MQMPTTEINPQSREENAQLIEKYLRSIATTTGLLHRNKLIIHFLIIFYASIDALGLLDAPPDQVEATGETFKQWAKKYLLNQPEFPFEFNEVDLWGARCGVLHTSSSASRLSNEGRAKELQYYAGPSNSPAAIKFIEGVKNMPGHKHLPAHIESMAQALLKGVANFAPILLTNCNQDPRYTTRLRKILQGYDM